MLPFDFRRNCLGIHRIVPLLVDTRFRRIKIAHGYHHNRRRYSWYTITGTIWSNHIKDRPCQCTFYRLRFLRHKTLRLVSILNSVSNAYTRWILNKVRFSLFLTFLFALLYAGYSLIYNPWHTLIFEALESVTLSLSFTAAVTYAAKLSTTTTDSSIQGLLGGVYYGVGKRGWIV